MADSFLFLEGLQKAGVRAAVSLQPNAHGNREAAEIANRRQTEKSIFPA
jgi:hypothetical protein